MNDPWPPVDPEDLLAGFQHFASACGVDPAADPHPTVFGAMLRYYAEVRINGCDPADDEDMLLLDWGSYDWGQGRSYEIDLSRQVLLPGGTDEAVVQLHVVYRFPNTGDLAKIPVGNDWWGSPGTVDEFAEVLNVNVAVAAAADARPLSVEIYLETPDDAA
ncbi:MAG: hypothetical protein WD178_08995 [Actinomycetota bacterium]